MLPFSPLLLSNALAEGLTSIATLLAQKDKAAADAVKKIIVTQFNFFSPSLGQRTHFAGFEKNFITDSYNEKKEGLREVYKEQTLALLTINASHL